MTRDKVIDTITRLYSEGNEDYYVYFKGHNRPIPIGSSAGYQARTEEHALDIIDEDAGILVGTFDYSEIQAITSYPIFID